MGRFKNIAKDLKEFRDRVTHEVPTGPHTDVKRRKLNPSFKKRITGVGPDIESGITKERKRKSKIMGMGLKNVVKRMIGQKEGGRIGLREGTKPLETAMHKKRAEQTQNVKRLTTSDDAYSPERRVLQVEKQTPYGSTGTRKVITDWHNIKEEGKKLKEKFVKKHGRGTLSLYDPPKIPRLKGKKVGAAKSTKQDVNKSTLIKPLHKKILGKREKKATGGRAGFKHGKFVPVANPHVDVAKYVDRKGKELEPERGRSRIKDSEEKVIKKKRKFGGPRFGRKSPYAVTNVRTQVIDALSGGREGKPHSSPEGREASAGRKLDRLIEKSKPFKKGGRIGYAGGSGSRPRPHGPHMWVKTSGAVMSGKKVGIQIK